MQHYKHERFQTAEYCEQCEREFEEWYWGQPGPARRRALAQAGAEMRVQLMFLFRPVVHGLAAVLAYPDLFSDLEIDTKELFV